MSCNKFNCGWKHEEYCNYYYFKCDLSKCEIYSNCDQCLEYIGYPDYECRVIDEVIKDPIGNGDLL